MITTRDQWIELRRRSEITVESIYDVYVINGGKLNLLDFNFHLNKFVRVEQLKSHIVAVTVDTLNAHFNVIKIIVNNTVINVA